jgi:hypothetical protein
VFCICIALTKESLAQNANDSLALAKAQERFQTFEDYFLIKIGATNCSLNFTLSPRINGIAQFHKPIWYRLSVKNSIGVSVQFKDLALSYGFKLGQHELLKNRQGKSEYSDLQIHSLGKRIGYDFYYQRYKGYFIENLDNLLNGLLSGDSLQRRDDIVLSNISANFFMCLGQTGFLIELHLYTMKGKIKAVDRSYFLLLWVIFWPVPIRVLSP